MPKSLKVLCAVLYCVPAALFSSVVASLSVFVLFNEVSTFGLMSALLAMIGTLIPNFLVILGLFLKGQRLFEDSSFFKNLLYSFVTGVAVIVLSFGMMPFYSEAAGLIPFMLESIGPLIPVMVIMGFVNIQLANFIIAGKKAPLAKEGSLDMYKDF